MLLTVYTALLLALEIYVTASPVPMPAPPPSAFFSSNPVVTQAFADPCIIQESNGTYWAFASNNTIQNVPIALSHDFNEWQMQPNFDALNHPGNWTAEVPAVWAPDVVELGNGNFVMYYAAAWAGNDSVHCVGAAFSPNVTGPYSAQPEPFVCPSEQGGAIDPSSFIDPLDGSQYVLYKIDGNTLVGGGPCGNAPAPPSTATPASTPIMMQKVKADDGTTPIGDPVKILDRGPDDGPLIEAPSLVAVQSDMGAGGYLYVLFFSSNCYSTTYYDISYATSVQGVEGGLSGYNKSSTPLLVSTDGGLNSPGGLDIAPDGQHVVLHSDAQPGDPSLRQMHAGVVSIAGTTVTI